MSDDDFSRQCCETKCVETRHEKTADGGFNQTQELGTILRALAEPRRRHLLYLLEQKQAAELEQLVAQFCCKKEGVPPDDVEPETVESVKTQLQHNGLPMMEGCGLIEYDRRSGAVRLSNPPEILTEILSLCKEFDENEF
ncbi:DUF7344 domain-containing protein [Natrarchaeobius chitinivorans]|uniref:DUF7344 domain-containing protein n=1 Tax=Natrarchaeobius chitinivorans TaxID=1679083 RepID=UPI000F5314AB|nr:hypothetical protein [Natrarchaeobius chitinivorans]